MYNCVNLLVLVLTWCHLAHGFVVPMGFREEMLKEIVTTTTPQPKTLDEPAVAVINSSYQFQGIDPKISGLLKPASAGLASSSGLFQNVFDVLMEYVKRPDDQNCIAPKPESHVLNPTAKAEDKYSFRTTNVSVGENQPDDIIFGMENNNMTEEVNSTNTVLMQAIQNNYPIQESAAVLGIDSNSDQMPFLSGAVNVDNSPSPTAIIPFSVNEISGSNLMIESSDTSRITGEILATVISPEISDESMHKIFSALNENNATDIDHIFQTNDSNSEVLNTPGNSFDQNALNALNAFENSHVETIPTITITPPHEDNLSSIQENTSNNIYPSISDMIDSVIKTPPLYPSYNEDIPNISNYSEIEPIVPNSDLPVSHDTIDKHLLQVPVEQFETVPKLADGNTLYPEDNNSILTQHLPSDTILLPIQNDQSFYDDLENVPISHVTEIQGTVMMPSSFDLSLLEILRQSILKQTADYMPSSPVLVDEIIVTSQNLYFPSKSINLANRNQEISISETSPNYDSQSTTYNYMSGYPRAYEPKTLFEHLSNPPLIPPEIYEHLQNLSLYPDLFDEKSVNSLPNDDYNDSTTISLAVIPLQKNTTPTNLYEPTTERPIFVQDDSLSTHEISPIFPTENKPVLPEQDAININDIKDDQSMAPSNVVSTVLFLNNVYIPINETDFILHNRTEFIPSIQRPEIPNQDDSFLTDQMIPNLEQEHDNVYPNSNVINDDTSYFRDIPIKTDLPYIPSDSISDPKNNEETLHQESESTMNHPLDIKENYDSEMIQPHNDTFDLQFENPTNNLYPNLYLETDQFTIFSPTDSLADLNHLKDSGFQTPELNLNANADAGIIDNFNNILSFSTPENITESDTKHDINVNSLNSNIPLTINAIPKIDEISSSYPETYTNSANDYTPLKETPDFDVGNFSISIENSEIVINPLTTTIRPIVITDSINGDNYTMIHNPEAISNLTTLDNHAVMFNPVIPLDEIANQNTTLNKTPEAVDQMQVEQVQNLETHNIQDQVDNSATNAYNPNDIKVNEASLEIDETIPNSGFQTPEVISVNNETETNVNDYFLNNQVPFNPEATITFTRINNDNHPNFFQETLQTSPVQEIVPNNVTLSETYNNTTHEITNNDDFIPNNSLVVLFDPDELTKLSAANDDLNLTNSNQNVNENFNVTSPLIVSGQSYLPTVQVVTTPVLNITEPKLIDGTNYSEIVNIFDIIEEQNTTDYYLNIPGKNTALNGLDAEPNREVKTEDLQNNIYNPVNNDPIAPTKIIENFINSYDNGFDPVRNSFVSVAQVESNETKPIYDASNTETQNLGIFPIAQNIETYPIYQNVEIPNTFNDFKVPAVPIQKKVVVNGIVTVVNTEIVNQPFGEAVLHQDVPNLISSDSSTTLLSNTNYGNPETIKYESSIDAFDGTIPMNNQKIIQSQGVEILNENLIPKLPSLSQPESNISTVQENISNISEIPKTEIVTQTNNTILKEATNVFDGAIPMNNQLGDHSHDTLFATTAGSPIINQSQDVQIADENWIPKLPELSQPMSPESKSSTVQEILSNIGEIPKTETVTLTNNTILREETIPMNTQFRDLSNDTFFATAAGFPKIIQSQDVEIFNDSLIPKLPDFSQPESETFTVQESSSNIGEIPKTEIFAQTDNTILREEPKLFDGTIPVNNQFRDLSNDTFFATAAGSPKIVQSQDVEILNENLIPKLPDLSPPESKTFTVQEISSNMGEIPKTEIVTQTNNTILREETNSFDGIIPLNNQFRDLSNDTFFATAAGSPIITQSQDVQIVDENWIPKLPELFQPMSPESKTSPVHESSSNIGEIPKTEIFAQTDNTILREETNLFDGIILMNNQFKDLSNDTSFATSPSSPIIIQSQDVETLNENWTPKLPELSQPMSSESKISTVQESSSSNTGEIPKTKIVTQTDNTILREETNMQPPTIILQKELIEKGAMSVISEDKYIDNKKSIDILQESLMSDVPKATEDILSVKEISNRFIEEERSDALPAEETREISITPIQNESVNGISIIENTENKMISTIKANSFENETIPIILKEDSILPHDLPMKDEPTNPIQNNVQTTYSTQDSFIPYIPINVQNSKSDSTFIPGLVIYPQIIDKESKEEIQLSPEVLSSNINEASNSQKPTNSTMVPSQGTLNNNNENKPGIENLQNTLNDLPVINMANDAVELPQVKYNSPLDLVNNNVPISLNVSQIHPNTAIVSPNSNDAIQLPESVFNHPPQISNEYLNQENVTIPTLILGNNENLISNHLNEDIMVKPLYNETLNNTNSITLNSNIPSEITNNNVSDLENKRESTDKPNIESEIPKISVQNKDASKIEDVVLDFDEKVKESVSLPKVIEEETVVSIPKIISVQSEEPSSIMQSDNILAEKETLSTPLFKMSELMEEFIVNPLQNKIPGQNNDNLISNVFNTIPDHSVSGLEELKINPVQTSNSDLNENNSTPLNVNNQYVIRETINTENSGIIDLEIEHPLKPIDSNSSSNAISPSLTNLGTEQDNQITSLNSTNVLPDPPDGVPILYLPNDFSNTSTLLNELPNYLKQNENADSDVKNTLLAIDSQETQNQDNYKAPPSYNVTSGKQDDEKTDVSNGMTLEEMNAEIDDTHKTPEEGTPNSDAIASGVHVLTNSLELVLTKLESEISNGLSSTSNTNDASKPTIESPNQNTGDIVNTFETEFAPPDTKVIYLDESNYSSAFVLNNTFIENTVKLPDDLSESETLGFVAANLPPEMSAQIFGGSDQNLIAVMPSDVAPDNTGF